VIVALQVLGLGLLALIAWRLEAQLELLRRAVRVQGGMMALSLQALRDEVARNRTVDESAKALIEGLVAKVQELIDAGGSAIDPAELQALVDDIKGSTDTLASAVSANTPAPPPTP
jgi:hypothetical protein